MHQNLDAGFGFVKPGVHGKSRFIQLPLPVVTGDGEQVRIPEEWNERGQETILRNPRERSQGRQKNEGTNKETVPSDGHKTLLGGQERHQKSRPISQPLAL